MITTLLIDIDDTLLDFKQCAKWSMEKTAQKMNILLPENAFECFEKINTSLWKQLEKKEITTNDIYHHRWQQVSSTLNIPFDGYQFEEYFLDFLSKSSIQVNHAFELLEYLSQKYKIYIASNGPYQQQINRMKLAHMDDFIEDYFVSEKIGYSKPSKEFFEACVKGTNVKDVCELMMIGDSLSADIQGAYDYGIQTCWVNLYHKEVNHVADYVIHDLLEIKDIL